MNDHLELELFSKVEVKTETKTSDVATISALFESHGWELRYAGTNPMLTEPVYEGKHFYLPDWLDPTIIPQEGLQRLKAIEEMGIEIQGVIIGHEVKKPEENRVIDVDWTELGQRARKTAKTTAAVTGAILGGIASALLVGFASTAESVFETVDPMLIIVLEDNTNLEIFWWLD